jgi:hypothetical protein
MEMTAAYFENVMEHKHTVWQSAVTEMLKQMQ